VGSASALSKRSVFSTAKFTPVSRPPYGGNPLLGTNVEAHYPWLLNWFRTTCGTRSSLSYRCRDQEPRNPPLEIGIGYSSAVGIEAVGTYEEISSARPERRSRLRSPRRTCGSKLRRCALQHRSFRMTATTRAPRWFLLVGSRRRGRSRFRRRRTPTRNRRTPLSGKKEPWASPRHSISIFSRSPIPPRTDLRSPLSRKLR
jgi:hypothetical protein